MTNGLRTLLLLLLGGWLLGLGSAAVAQPRGGAPTVAIQAKPSSAQVAPGGQLTIAVVMDHGTKLHSWPSADQDVLPESFGFAERTEIGVSDPAGRIGGAGPVQWPEPHPASVPNPSGEGPETIEVPTYSGRAIAYLPLLVDAEAPAGPIEIPVRVRLQACDDRQCYMPQEETHTVRVEVTATPAPPAADEDFRAFDASVFTESNAWSGQVANPAGAEQPSPEKPPQPDTRATGGVKFLGLFAVPSPDSPAFLPVIVGFGLIAGFVLNLTPCVLPVIPIKIMTLTNHAGGDRRRTMQLGAWMFLGVVAFWTALAIPVLGIKGFTDPSVIFGIWWVTAGIGALIFIMAFGLMGFFQISLPQGAYMVNPKADTPSGSFLFGVMTAVLGLPCFGFVIGALLPQAVAADWSVVVALFVSLGVGMGGPYFLLALRPDLLKRVPKTGPASDLVKQVMALLLMAAGAYFIGAGLIVLVTDFPYMGRVLHWWAVAGFVVSAGGWLVYRSARITKKPIAPAVFGVLSLFLAAGAVWWAVEATTERRVAWEAAAQARLRQAESGVLFATGAWNDFTPKVLEAALATDKVVVLDFTAEWCLNCKALERAVLNADPVKPVLMSDDVIAVKADLSSRSSPGWAKLSDLGQTGIPTLAVFGPGLPDGPWIANAYSSGQVLEAISRARGRSMAAAE